MANPNSVYEKVHPITTYGSVAEETAKFIDQEGKGTDVIDKLASDKISADYLERILNEGGKELSHFFPRYTPWKNMNSSDKFELLMDTVLEDYYEFSSDTQPKVVCTKEEKHDWYILRKLDSYISHRLYQGVAYSDMKELYGKDKLIQLLKSDMDSLKNSNTNENVSDYLIIFGEEYGARPKSVSREMELLYEQFIRDPSNNEVINEKLYRIYQKVLKDCQSEK